MNCEEFIQDNNLIKAGEIIGVGCSGGSDSVALLHYLSKMQESLDIEVVAIHIDHQIREDSYLDAELVKDLAKELGVRYYKFRVDVPKLAKEKGQGIEEGSQAELRGELRGRSKSDPAGPGRSGSV